ncbi:unnamed protein product [Mucor circinelloides]|uniref:Glutathione S-transferase n=1 Tax=Mucor circinelloides f. circinelloides (strain 1006PhL) TaxID=1220926 RepID=S2K9C4_MUCC1|nr:hypothetical protein HMPREF1544_01097 [Mucor circinelloides 1006PhL]
MDKINLYYFTVGDSVTRARGENVKLLLEDAGLDHEYIRVKHEEWPALKQKLQAEGLHSATLPFIETNGQKFVKAPAIMRYISTKLGGKYHGSTPEENQLLDVVAELNDVWFEHLKNSFFGSEEMKVKYANETLPAQISLFEKYYSDREGPYLLGEKLTYADILVYHMIDDGGARSKLDGDAPHLLKFVEAFEERPNLKKYFASLK